MKTKQFLLRPRWLLLFLLFAYLFVAPPPEARAQNAEFAPIGAKWTYLIPSHDMFENQDDIGWAITRSVGDTLIEGKICRIIKGYHNAYLHIENGVVEHYFDGEFYTLFDFNKNVGEFWYSKIPYAINDLKIQVDSIKNIQNNNNILSKRLYVTAYSDTICGLAVEDIPYLDPVFLEYIDEKTGAYPDFFPFRVCGTDYTVPVLNCYEDNEVSTSLLSGLPNVDVCEYSNVGFNDRATDEMMPRIFPSLVRDKRLYCENHLFEEGSITINNLQGVAVFHQSVYKGVSALDLPALPQGMYWVVFQNKNYYSTTKIIIQP